MSERRELSPGLRRAYLLVLAPAAFVAPLPLLWTDGVSPAAILLYEVALLFLWLRAKTGNPVRLSDFVLNVAGLGYFAWLVFEASTLRLGLLRSVSHLLLFTAIAKFGSLKRPGEARLALLVVFLLTLASASSSTHVSSLLYLAAMAWVGFRTLGRLAVLADFDDAPPERVLTAVPTLGLATAAIAAGIILTPPLFFALPRLRSPFAVAPYAVSDALSQSLAADRVDLESFGAAKRSDRIILRLEADPELARSTALRLREAVFTDYQDGIWTRDPRVGPRRGERQAYALGVAPSAAQPIVARVSVDLNVYGTGFLFLPYGTASVRLERGREVEMPDGVLQVATSRGTVRYIADIRRAPARGPGSGAIALSTVPDEIREYAVKLTGDLTKPEAIYQRIEGHFQRDFVYTLDSPRPQGDPLVHFLLRSRAGHCEYFASAAAMMLTARGIRARLVTGSFGGESGIFSRTIVVRAENLHAWVEADLDGSGFRVVDPTPASGIPPALRPFSILSRLTAIGREIEFFYDRRILGFDAADQVGVVEAMRESAAAAASALGAMKIAARNLLSPTTVVVALALGLGLLLGVRGLAARRPAPRPATRAYLALRRLLVRRGGAVSPATAPAEVARRFAEIAPETREDARAIVAVYAASAFGGREVGPETTRELDERLRRLRRRG